jgi:hypothetical protein
VDRPYGERVRVLGRPRLATIDDRVLAKRVALNFAQESLDKHVQEWVQLGNRETELPRQESVLLVVVRSVQDSPVDDVRHAKVHLFHVGNLPHGHVAVLDALRLLGHVVPIDAVKVMVKVAPVHFQNVSESIF